MLFFDLDDTILDTKTINRKVFVKIHQDLQVPMDLEDFMGTFRRILRVAMLRHFDFLPNESIGINPMDYLMTQEPYEPQHMEAFKEDVWTQLRDLGLTCTRETFFQTILNRREDFSSFIPGMEEVLEEVAKLDSLGLITNGISEIQHGKVQALGLEKSFKKIFVSGDFGYGKPDPRFYQFVLDEVKLEGKDCIMIGDNIQNDVLGSMAMGFQAIFFKEEKTRYLVPQAKTPQELLEKIKALYH